MIGPGTNTIRLSDSARGLRAAAALLRQGQTVAFPTETVYGLGADARDGQAVARIYAAKDRPAFNPLSVHLADAGAAAGLAQFSQTAARLAAAFWPGPLTLLLPLDTRAGISPLVTAGGARIALRVPAHPLARALLRASGAPLAAPSANPSGKVSPTTADHVLEGLGGRIAAVVDGGPCPVGVEATILDLSDATPRLLRPGGLPIEAVETCLGQALAPAPATADIRAPGQLTSHYAPRAALRLAKEGTPMPEAPLWLAFGPLGGRRGVTLSETGDLVEAAARLFAALRELDALAAETGIERIGVDPIPETGLGAALNDRLRRAAAPRPPAYPHPV